MLQLLKPDGTLNHSLDQTRQLISLDAPGYRAIYHAMCKTRVFYDHCERIETKRGQVRLHIGPRGQEAAEVASAYALDPNDWIFYYARSYGTALTRNISFRSLLDTFYYYGAPPEHAVDDFLQHKILLPYTYVGMHIPHAIGAGWAEKLQGSHAIAVAYFGDGATAEGDFHSALWASVFNVPVVLVCENNQYAISTPVHIQNPAATFAEKARAYAIGSEVVDGNDPLAMYAAMKYAASCARDMHKPTLIEAVTYRDGPHTSAVGEICAVPDEEKILARENDPLKRFKLLRLSEAGRALFESEWSEEQDQALRAALAKEIHEVADEAYQDFTNVYEMRKAQGYSPPPLSRRPRARRNLRAQDNAFIPEIICDADCRDAANFALFDALTTDAEQRIICIGQDIGHAGGVMRTTSLAKSFVQQYIPHMQDHVIHGFLPLKHLFPERIFDAPLNEAAIIGVSLGMSIAGMRPIFEMQFSGFVRSALHHAQEYGRLPYRHNNIMRLPGVCRLPFGHGDRIEYHNECEIAEFAQIHGIVIACPSTPQDFYDMLFAATMSNRMTAFFEHLDLYRMISLRQEITRLKPVRAIEDFGIRIAREGEDITIASYGRMLHECLAASADLAAQNISAEVLDLRILMPLDKAALLDSVRKTGRLLVVQEECAHGFGAHLIASVADEALEYIRAPRIPLLSSPCGFAPPPRFWEFHVPSKDSIVEQVRELIQEE